MNGNNLLIWDIDGTLIQGRGIGRLAMNMAFSELFNIDNGFEDIDMAGRLDSVILNEAFNKYHINFSNRKLFFTTYCKHLEREISASPSSIEAPGIIDLLQEVSRKKNIYNVLGTGNIENAARIKLGKHDMNKFFPTGGFGDNESERWQVIEDAIIKAKKLFGKDFSTKNIYVIGDTPRDIECGKRLGIRSIGVATGSYTVQELTVYTPDYAFENLIDITGFMGIF